jgi:hypothetical protein
MRRPLGRLFGSGGLAILGAAAVERKPFLFKSVTYFDIFLPKSSFSHDQIG